MPAPTVAPPPRASRPVRYGAWDLATAARHVEAGLPVGVLDVVKAALALSDRALADVLLTSERTLARRRAEGRLAPDESERALRIARLTELATDTLGGPDAARAWMREPNFALGDAAPLALARTEPGARLVERLLEGLAHGDPL